MAVKLTCPECEAPLTVPDSFLGKTLRCKHCGETFKAKAPRELEDDDEEDDRLARKAGKKQAKAGGWVLYLVGVLAALVLVAAAIGAVLWSRGYFGDTDKADASRPAMRLGGPALRG
jgi:predicted Zn finger-like uncharacterized protein